MRATSPLDGHSAGVGYNLAGIALLVMLMAVGSAYVVDRLGRAAAGNEPGLEDGAPVSQTISGTTLAIPQNWFRFGEQVREGFANQVDLRVMLTLGDSTVPVDVTLLPRSRARTSASLLDAVYLHQFGDETLGGVPGLVGKPMVSSGEGFAGESVWYDAISPNPFVAKCMDGVADRQAQCVRTVYLPSGIAAVYAFDAAILPHWRQFDTEMQRWLGLIGAWPAQ